MTEAAYRDWMKQMSDRNDELEDALVDLVAELRQQIDRGKLGSGWMVTHVPAFYRAEDLLR